MSSETKTENIWTPANIVTLIRICGVPVFVAALLSPWPQWIPFEGDPKLFQAIAAAVIFGILAGTDGVDGYLARSRGEVTNFGKFIDPLADKILVAAALLALVELQVLPSWVALIILAREFIVSGLRMIAANNGLVVAASWYGKAKTVTQIIAIILFLVKDVYLVGNAHVLTNPLYLLAWLVMIVAVVLTIVSMVDYFYKCRTVLGFGKKKAEDSDKAITAEDLVAALSERGMTVCTAESLTGGLISASITAVPGSSSVIKGGVVSYVNEIKANVLGVDKGLLDVGGPVTEATAKQMADGVRVKYGTDIAVSVTGIAGPTGAEPGKPVGTVWMGISSEAGTYAIEHHFEGDRDSVRKHTVDAAIKALFEESKRVL